MEKSSVETSLSEKLRKQKSRLFAWVSIFGGVCANASIDLYQSLGQWNTEPKFGFYVVMTLFFGGLTGWLGQKYSRLEEEYEEVKFMERLQKLNLLPVENTQQSLAESSEPIQATTNQE